MLVKLIKESLQRAEVKQIERVSGEISKNCYQCGNCTAGCPVSYAMDIPPTQMIRKLQMGQYDDLVGSESMWLCLGCLQCYSRCPKSVSAASFFEGLRQMSLRHGEDHEKISDVPLPLIKKAPQQAIVAGFRKLVS